VTRARVALLAAAACAGEAAAAAPPRCLVSVELQPPRAWVGQQVHYRVHILRRHDVAAVEWETPLSFPTFRAEGLPIVASDSPVASDGETFLEFVDRRAIFPAHPGHLEIPAAALRCGTTEGEEIVSVPRQSLDVDALPADGQPADFGGLVGPVTVRAQLSARRIALGGTLRLVVLVEGPTNVWAATSPRAALEAIPDVDVFEHPAQLARDAGRTLGLRRYWSFDLVPRSARTLRVPDLRFGYFDPVAARYAEAHAPGAAVEVVDAPAPRAQDPLPAEPPPAPPDGRTRIARRWLLFGVAIFAAAGVAALWRGLRRRRGRGPRAGRADRFGIVDVRDLSAEDRAMAVRKELARRVLGAETASAEELLGRAPPTGPIRDAAYLLVQLDAARFGGSEVAPPDEDVARVLRALREVPPLGR
jgi:hypothetical protein